MNKILICGSGPSILKQLKGRDLSEFQKVVRVNTWEEIKGSDNRCDAWAFYPHHQIGEASSAYDLKPYLAKAKEIWMPHWGFYDECKRITGRYPDYIITEDQTRLLHQLIGHPDPTSGAVVVYMATLLDVKVYIAGFDFYKGDKKYYYSKGKPQTKEDLSHHKPWLEKKWFDGLIKKKQIIVLPETKRS